MTIAMMLVGSMASQAYGQSKRGGDAASEEGLHSLVQGGMAERAARRFLELSSRGRGVTTDIRRIMGADYGAVWWDQDIPRLNVGIPQTAVDPTIQPRIEQHLRAHGVFADTKILEIPWGERELEEIQDKVSSELHDLMLKGLLITGIRARIVVVTVAASIDPASLARIEATARSFRGAVTVERAVETDLTIKHEACQRNAFCDRPMRGGVRIGASGPCTAGFNVRSRSDAKYFVLTDWPLCQWRQWNLAHTH